MALIAEITIGGPNVLLGPTLRAVPNAEVDSQYQATAAAYTIGVEGCSFERLEAALEEDPSVENHRVIADYGDRRIYRVNRALNRPLLSEVTAQLDAQVIEGRATGGEWHLRLRLPDREALAAVADFCDEHEIPLSVERLYSELEGGSGRADVVTAAQRAVLLAAAERGYFEEPRQCSLEELAEALDISSTAASGRLRRGMSNLVEHHLR